MRKLQDLTLREKIGQLIMAGFKAEDIDDHVLQMVKEAKIGNIILFTRNIKSARQLYRLNRKLYELIYNELGIYPLVSIDQEGGMVTRILEDATFLPGNMTLGATNNPEYAYRAGQISGQELISLGINVNLAPVLDIATNAYNPVIGVRSYSSDPETVALFGARYTQGLQESGVIGVGKHFPGHGDTDVDSHYGLPKVDAGRGRLNSVELVPFKEAIKNQIKGIMSAHILFPSYEKEQLPATLSSKVLTDLLRDQLGYEGLVFTDCMEMKAIADHYGTHQGALQAVIAGANQVCISHTLSEQLKAVDLIEAAVKNGEISEDLINERVERVLKAKADLLDQAKAFVNSSEDEAIKVLITKEHHSFAEAVVDESLTLVKGEPFSLKERTLLIASDPFATSIADDEVDSKSIVKAVRDQIPSIATIKMAVRPSVEEQKNIIDQAAEYEQVVICTYNANIYQEQLELVKKLLGLNLTVYVISMRNPYDLVFIPEIKNYVCLYEYTKNSIKTLIKYLKGEISPKGSLPIKNNKSHKTGVSVYIGLAEYSLQDNLRYLEHAKASGAEMVFTSAHMPEMSKDFLSDLDAIINKVLELKMKLVIDVSKPMMENFKIPKGTYALRLDYGFKDDEIVKMSNELDLFIELNASTLSPERMQKLIDMGLNVKNIRVSHNFYPKAYTGLTHEQVRRQNEFFKTLGLDILMYIPSQHQKRPPLKEGLPTVEAHRKMPLDVVIQEVLMLGATEICFGDAYASIDEIKTVAEFDVKEIILPIRLVEGLSDEEIRIINSPHRSRMDESVYLKRSTAYRGKVTISAHNTIAREKYAVTIDNDGYLRYRGELNIVMESLPADPRVNVVGYIDNCEYLLENLKPGTRFRFRVRNK
ncbi:MAG: MupG family TIM beta-alpha barrel fold protein [Bacilli bacterium]|jgi:beta-N-acetylhexosaminidase